MSAHKDEETAPRKGKKKREATGPGVVKRSWRYFLRFSALFSTLMDWKRLPIVPVDSSAARMPLPGVAIALCFSPLVSARRLSFAQRPPRQDDGLCKEGRTAVAINSSLNLSAIVAACVCVLGGFAVCCCRVAQSRAKKKRREKCCAKLLISPLLLFSLLLALVSAV